MAIFKLKRNDGDLIDAELIEATKKDLDLEKHLECWLEKSPWAIAQEPPFTGESGLDDVEVSGGIVEELQALAHTAP